jgi:type I restriction-modification system DNA methylase subunit
MRLPERFMDNNFSTDEKTARLSSQLGMAYDILRAEASLHNMDILTIILVLLAYKRFSDIHESNEKDSHPSGKVIISIPPDFRWEKLIGNPQPLRLLASHFREICRRNQELERLGEVIEIERYIEQLPFPSQWELINLFGNLDLSQSSWSDNGLSQTVSRFIEEWNQGNGDSNNDLIPYGLSKLLVNVLDVRKTDSIYFPACGLGTSIMAAIDHLSRDIFSEPDKSSLVQSIQIRGEEKNREALAFALLRLAIAGHRGIDLTNEDYLTTTYEDLYRGVAGPIPRRFKAAFSENLEALRSEEAVEAFINAFRESEHIDKKEEGFLELFRRVSRKYSTVTILTPPFGLHLSRNLPNTLWFEGDNVEVPSGRGEFMFLLLALQMVSSRGKLGILIPAKYLTQVNLTNKIWSMLVNSDYLEVILTLPERYGYAHIPLALAIFNKEKPKFKKNKVAFAKLQGVPHNQKVIITDDDISSISKFSKTFEPVRDDQVIVTLEEITGTLYRNLL